MYYLDDILLTGATAYEKTHPKFKEYHFGHQKFGLRLNEAKS